MRGSVEMVTRRRPQVRDPVYPDRVRLFTRLVRRVKLDQDEVAESIDDRTAPADPRSSDSSSTRRTRSAMRRLFEERRRSVERSGKVRSAVRAHERCDEQNGRRSLRSPSLSGECTSRGRTRWAPLLRMCSEWEHRWPRRGRLLARRMADAFLTARPSTSPLNTYK